MKTEIQQFYVHSSTPPTIEVDTEAAAVYVRFKNAKVARTVPRPSGSMILAIDLDSKNEVIGIEAVGLKEFGIRIIQNLIQKAEVKAPLLDFRKVRYVPAAMVHA
ncbi:MAG: hypothetical protein ACOYM3_29815 [Terrimicrobiaceae bacterium]